MSEKDIQTTMDAARCMRWAGEWERHAANAITALVNATEARRASERVERRARRRLLRLMRKYGAASSPTDAGGKF